MTLEPLLHAPLTVQAHVATVLPAGLLGLWLLVFSRTGSRGHLFVPFVLFATWRAIDGALTGRISQHRRWVVGLFVGAILINGINNVFFLPGITHDVFFGR